MVDCRDIVDIIRPIRVVYMFEISRLLMSALLNIGVMKPTPRWYGGMWPICMREERERNYTERIGLVESIREGRTLCGVGSEWIRGHYGNKFMVVQHACIISESATSRTMFDRCLWFKCLNRIGVSSYILPPNLVMKAHALVNSTWSGVDFVSVYKSILHLDSG